MAQQPRIAYAKRGGSTRLHTPQLQVPIIIVPGVMASRLSDPASGALAWNPLGSPIGDCAGGFKVDYDRLRQLSAELVPDETNTWEGDDDGKHAKALKVKHYYNLLADVYEPLIDALLSLGASVGPFGGPAVGAADASAPAPQPDVGADIKLEELGVVPRLYCCGYDWRQDNARSALRLASVVEEALRDTGAKRVIIIAHSMGCTVSRYYCRVLGGEARVHRLIMLGSPTLGAPSAYNYLKIGPPGIYFKDVMNAAEAGDESAAVFELMRSGGAALQALTNVTTTEWSTIQSAFGDIYVALCLGAGRWLSRRETTFFARQMPSLYQLLPTSVFCRERNYWMVFDPLATGYAPTGYMVILPTLFEAIVMGVASFSDASEEQANSVRDAFDPEAKTRTSGRATRNAMTIGQLFEQLAQALDVEDAGALLSNIGTIAELVKDFKARVLDAMFFDCRKNDLLYADIYTGFLDHVEMRAVSAGNLALGLRMEQALTVKHRFEEALTPFPLLGKLLGPLFELPAMQAVGAWFEDAGLTIADAFDPDEHLVFGKRVEDRRKERALQPAKDKLEEEKKKKALPRAYIPPGTVNIFSSGLGVEGGGVLLPIAVISKDDTNVVKAELLPNYVAAIAGFVAESSGVDLWYGDGTVPAFSVNPTDDLLSRPFFSRVELPAVVHSKMCADPGVITEVKRAIVQSLDAFVEGHLGLEEA